MDDIEAQRQRVAEARVLFAAGQIGLDEMHRILSSAVSVEVPPDGWDDNQS